MAVSICKSHNAKARDVYLYFLNELKECMKRGVGGIGIPNNQNYNLGETLDERPYIY